MKLKALPTRLFALLRRALNIGVDYVGDEDRVYVRQINLNGLFFCTMDLILAGVFYIILNDAHLSMGLLASSALFLSFSIGFNFLGWTTLSRLSTTSIGSFLVLYCALYVGADSFTAASLLLGAIFPFVYFSVRDKLSILICLLVPFTCYCFLIFFDYTLGPKMVVADKDAIFWIRLIMFSIPFFGILVNTYIAVSEREKKARMLKESQKLLETIFFALSHDMANPIQTLSFITELSHEPEQYNKEKIKKLKMSTRQIVRIFSNLSDVIKASVNGKIRLNMQEVEVGELLQEAIQFIRPRLETKCIEIEYKISELERKSRVTVDRDIFVFQVITNFLTNAVKFSEVGQKIKIHAAIENEEVCFTIRDWGVGIEPEKLEKLFSWMDQTTTEGTSGEKGTGLGLPLAYKFIQSMNGNLKIESFHKSQFDISRRGTLISIKIPASRLSA